MYFVLSVRIIQIERYLPWEILKRSVPDHERDEKSVDRDVVLTLKALPYGKVHDIERFTQDADVHILLAGCTQPDLKDERLHEKFGGETPADVVKKLLLAGEITDLSQANEKLSGYRRMTITEVKNA